MRVSTLFTGLIISAVTLTSVSTASALSYTNRYKTTTNSMTYMQDRHFMNGYSNGSFGENNLVNRAEFAKIVTSIRSSGLSGRSSSLPFRDTSASSWYAPYVSYVYQNGYMTGYSNNTFRPENSVTFAEAAKVLALVYNLDTSFNGSFWYSSAIQALSRENAIPLSISFVDQQLTRGEISEIIYRLDAGVRNLSSRSHNDFSYNNNDDYYYRRNIGSCRNGREVAVTLDPDETSVTAGEIYSYDITVQNCTGTDQHVDVIATLDDKVTFDSASDRGYTNGVNRVDWDSVPLYSGQSRTITLTVQVKSRISRNDTIDLTVRAIDDDRNSDSNSVSVSVSGSGNNSCYYDSRNRYICENTGSDCWYDSSNRYICNNNVYNNDCYYDAYNNYVCNNSSNNNCYYDSYNRYVCNHHSTNNNCYYDSNNNYICNNYYNGNNCYYDSYNNYVCN